jgi:hypothetical protein
VLLALLLLPCCATKAMREQAGVLAAAGERLEIETAAFSAARTGVVQLRQRGLIQRKQEVAEQGQHNARTVAQWKVAGTPDRARRLALFEGVRAASEATYEVRDQGLLWEESVLYSRTALAIDRAALHRFIRGLVNLSRPTRFIDGARFYAEYGATVAAQVDEGLAEVKSGLAGAQESARPESVAPIGSGGGTRPETNPTPTPTPTPNPNPNPNTIGEPPRPPTPPGPDRPDSLTPGPRRDTLAPLTPKP